MEVFSYHQGQEDPGGQGLEATPMPSPIAVPALHFLFPACRSEEVGGGWKLGTLSPRNAVAHGAP